MLACWLLFVLGVYVRGFVPRCRRGLSAFRPWRACSFALGLFVLWAALSSPLDAYGGYLLSVHMAQHFLLMMIVPPLVLLGNPGVPLLMGVSKAFRQKWLEPLLASAVVRRSAGFAVRPIVGWLSLAAVTWVWHLPVLYRLGLVSASWHRFEHVCFLAAGFAFWWCVILPYPAAFRRSRWFVMLYLLSADVQNTVFSAIFVFAERVIYPTYAATSPAIGFDALRDQALAGAIMWVGGSIVFLLPIAAVVTGIFASGKPVAVRKRQRIAAGKPSPRTVSLRVVETKPKSFVPRRRYRLAFRWAMLVLAAVVVVDGLIGPRTAAMNAAGVLPFTHWRGALVLGLLVVGNVFCGVCPIIVPGMVVRRLVPFSARLRWPDRLRSKWLVVGLVVGWLWAYEAFALWASPVATAWIIVGYFAAALFIDSLFKGASFCKWVCPIGQFNFVSSMVSPMEVAAIDASVCAKCTTRECIRGSDRVAGCGLELYIPAKVGNLDCTMCLDCADACPHDNVGIRGRSRTWDVVGTKWRSSIGRLSRRSDLAALVLVIVFGAFANAMGMVGPVLAWEDGLAAQFGFESRLVPATVLVLGVIVVVPAVLVGMSGRRRWRSLAYALIPIGFAMWFVHFGFHFATSVGTAVSVVQRMAGDIGVGVLGVPEWIWGCCVVLPSWLLPLEVMALDIGLVGSLLSVGSMTTGRVWTRSLWMVVVVGLFALGIWIVLQPMEMRGTVL